MGDLITMTRATAPSRVPPQAGESAAILFFTGVRYYRMEEPAAPVRRARAPRRRTGKVGTPDTALLDCHA